MSWSIGFNNEITKFLKEKRRLYIGEDKVGDLADFEPYFMGLENAQEEEKRQYGPCAIACFRSLGYTMGHVVVDKDMVIKDIIVYDRHNIQDYKEHYTVLNEEMRKKFLGHKLVLEEKVEK